MLWLFIFKFPCYHKTFKFYSWKKWKVFCWFFKVFFLIFFINKLEIYIHKSNSKWDRESHKEMVYEFDQPNTLKKMQFYFCLPVMLEKCIKLLHIYICIWNISKFSLTAVAVPSSFFICIHTWQLLKPHSCNRREW